LKSNKKKFIFFAAYFAPTGAGFELIEGILHDLQLDRDRDVRYFSGGLHEASYDMSNMTPLSEDSTIDHLESTEQHPHQDWTEVQS
jgi:hypothetical protein